MKADQERAGKTEQLNRRADILVESIRRGEKSESDHAWAELYKMFRDGVRFAVLPILRSPDAADELIQRLFVKVHERLDQFTLGSSFSAWITTIARNMALNDIRDSGRRGQIGLKNAGVMAALHGSERVIDPIRRIEDQEVSASMREVMDKLTPAHQEILQLRYFEDLSYLEMADRLEVPLGTVMSRLSRAQSSLRELLQEGKGAKQKRPKKLSRLAETSTEEAPPSDEDFLQLLKSQIQEQLPKAEVARVAAKERMAKIRKELDELAP